MCGWKSAEMPVAQVINIYLREIQIQADPPASKKNSSTTFTSSPSVLTQLSNLHFSEVAMQICTKSFTYCNYILSACEFVWDKGKERDKEIARLNQCGKSHKCAAMRGDSRNKWAPHSIRTQWRLPGGALTQQCAGGNSTVCARAPNDLQRHYLWLWDTAAWDEPQINLNQSKP